MAFFTLNSVTYEVLSMTEQAPELGGGESVRSYSGLLRTTYQWQKRGFDLELADLSEVNYIVLYNALALAPHVPINGDSVSGGPLTCEVTLTGAPFVKSPGSFLRKPLLSARQV